MLVLVLLLAFLAACGGPQAAAPASGPDCTTVASHLVELAERDNGATASPTLAADLRAELERNCRDDAWSDARRSCLAGASNQEATLDCPAE